MQAANLAPAGWADLQLYIAIPCHIDSLIIITVNLPALDYRRKLLFFKRLRLSCTADYLGTSFAE